MKVYIVLWRVDIDDHGFAAVFQTKEAAEAFAKRSEAGDPWQEARYSVEEHEVRTI